MDPMSFPWFPWFPSHLMSTHFFTWPLEGTSTSGWEWMGCWRNRMILNMNDGSFPKIPDGTKHQFQKKNVSTPYRYSKLTILNCLKTT